MKKLQIILQATDRESTHHVTTNETVLITIYQARKTFDDRLQPVRVGTIKIQQTSINIVEVLVTESDSQQKAPFLLSNI